jgi:hypothetical protein
MIKTTQDGPGNGVPGEKLGVGSWVDLLSGMHVVSSVVDFDFSRLTADLWAGTSFCR